MKRSKLAAGALALALGLGAVAPVVEATAGQGNAVVQENYRKEYERKLVKAYNEMKEAELAFEEAKAAADAQQAKVDELNAKIDAWYKAKKAAKEALEAAQAELAEAKAQNTAKGDTDLGAGADQNLEEKEAGAAEKVRRLEEAYKEYLEKDAEDSDVNVKNDLEDELNGKTRDGNKIAELKKLQRELDVEVKVQQELNGKASAAKEKADNRKVDKEELEEKAADYVESVAGILAAAEAQWQATKVPSVDVKPSKPADKDDKAVSAETLATLEKVVAEAENTIKAVKLLQDYTPQTIRNVADKLEALVAEQEKQLESARAILKANKKSALNVLFTTAYAADATAEEVDQLIKDIENSTKEINDVLKENEKEQEQEAKKEEEEQKPAEEEQKPAEDKKDEDKKDEEKKPAEANKKAGNNVKTGVAGVAGVAAVLAAASAAYVASKRD